MAKHLFAAVTHRHTAACAGLSKHDKCALCLLKGQGGLFQLKKVQVI